MTEYPATLSVDLGASYTKVSYRPRLAPTRPGPFAVESQILTVDGSPLIPSLAIYTGDKKQPWLFGQTAARTKPSADMKVLVNWKSNFFRPGNDELSVEAVVAAGHFFAWLKDQIDDATMQMAQTETRVAMPAFDEFEKKAQMLARCMELNSWNSPKILKATEPHANTIGLFSCGRNAVGRDGHGELHLQYNQMFRDNVYIQTARNMILAGANPTLRVLIVDIGAFTTDLAALIFDTRAEDDGLQSIKAESHALGVINELDRDLFRAIGTRHGFEWVKLSFDESEVAKRKLHAGERVALLLPNFKGEIGDEQDQIFLAQHVEAFATKVWQKIKAVIETQEPSVVFLTGGGSLINAVSTYLNANLRAEGISVTHVQGAAGQVGDAKWRRWEDTGEGLARLATALGGSCVILQDGGLQRRRERLGPVNIPEPNYAYTECSCRGGNKDCCKCSGRGYYAKS